jgi:hypothetical protein
MSMATKREVGLMFHEGLDEDLLWPDGDPISDEDHVSLSQGKSICHFTVRKECVIAVSIIFPENPYRDFTASPPAFLV